VKERITKSSRKMFSFTKSFSTKAAVGARRMMATANHEPPKKIHGTNGRYAVATYRAASKVIFLL